MDELIENNYMLESDLIKRQLQMGSCNTTEKYELMAAKYSLDIVNNLHSYTLKYLNRLIHGLLTVTAKLTKHYSNLEFDFSVVSLPLL